MNFLLPIGFLSSACGLLHSQILVQTLGSLVSDAIAVQVWTMGFYMAGLGIGAALAGLTAKDRTTKTLLLAEKTLCFTGLLGPVWIYALYFLIKYFLHEADSLTPADAVASSQTLLLLSSQIPALILGLFSGASLTLLLRLAKTEGTGRLLAVNYLGALAATLAFVSLAQRLSPLQLSAFAVVLNLGLVAYLNWRFEPRAWNTSALLFATLFGLSAMGGHIEQWHLQSRYMNLSEARKSSFKDTVVDLFMRPKILRVQTPFQRADFVPYGPLDYIFFLDGHPQLHPRWITRYHESLVHVPIQYAGRVPKRILVLGGGDGLVAREILKYGDRVEKVDLVELDPWMIEAARANRYFTKLNQGSLKDPRINVVRGDAFQFVRLQNARYDAIYADFPLPFSYDLLKLYSVEFYRLVARALKEDGFLAFDSAMLFLNSANPEESEGFLWNMVLQNTLRAAGFSDVRPFMGSELFVFARPTAKDVGRIWQDHGIEVLSGGKDLLERSFRTESYFTERPDLINSVFKPSLHAARSLEF